MVYPSSKLKGLMTAPHLAQRILLSPVPSTRLEGHGVPHPGQFLSTKGSSPKAALFVTMVPEEVASDSTRIDSMMIARVSTTLATSRVKGHVTSCPTRYSSGQRTPHTMGRTIHCTCLRP